MAQLEREGGKSLEIMLYSFIGTATILFHIVYFEPETISVINLDLEYCVCATNNSKELTDIQGAAYHSAVGILIA